MNNPQPDAKRAGSICLPKGWKNDVAKPWEHLPTGSTSCLRWQGRGQELQASTMSYIWVCYGTPSTPPSRTQHLLLEHLLGYIPGTPPTSPETCCRCLHKAFPKVSPKHFPCVFSLEV